MSGVRATIATIVGVPGTWADREAILAAIAEVDGFAFTGEDIVERQTEQSMLLEIYDHDPAMRQAFEIAGRASELGEADLDAVGAHTFCLYLVDQHGGTLDGARRMIRFASALLDAGGLAVKVESSGKAHSAEEWRQMAERPELPALFHAFVTYARAEEGLYSCGMHNIGYPDVVVAGDLPVNDAGPVIDSFLMYQLLEDPDLGDGDTFGVAADAPRFRIERKPCTLFPEQDPFHNPFGVWELTAAE